MPSPTFTFLNHASWLLRTDSALLLVDPWLEGTVHNDACRLLDGTTGSAGLIAALHASGLPVFIWCSSSRPDHLSRLFIQRFRAEFRGIATFLCREGDWRLAHELRRYRLAVAECPAGAPRALAPGLHLTAHADGECESYCLIACGRYTLLHLGERVLATAAACRRAAAQLRMAQVRVDLLLTSFADLAWHDNPDDATGSDALAKRGIARMACQAEAFRPRLVVPVASFAQFSRIDNAWRNHGRSTPLDVLEAPGLAGLHGVIRFMAPGAQFDLTSVTPATLRAQHDTALAYWMTRWREQPAPLPRPPQATLAALKEAFASYLDRAGMQLHGLPRWLEWLGVVRPLRLALPDLRRTIVLSYRHGLRPLARDAPADIAMCSGTALYLLGAEDGFDTTVAGGCLRSMHARGVARFGRFFLPQRLCRRVLERQRPSTSNGALLRALLAWAWQAIRTQLP
ncbi:hypothetical protein RCH14_000688 [Massilia sp. MP_M2]|uniref:MBL fold metallo-hydrolase n=1 Tax=Massilia sp. MP_M2 TaxID=3071713 RepID=UPI00319E5BEF